MSDDSDFMVDDDEEYDLVCILYSVHTFRTLKLRHRNVNKSFLSPADSTRVVTIPCMS